MKLALFLLPLLVFIIRTASASSCYSALSPGETYLEGPIDISANDYALVMGCKGDLHALDGSVLAASLPAILYKGHPCMFRSQKELNNFCSAIPDYWYSYIKTKCTPLIGGCDAEPHSANFNSVIATDLSYTNCSNCKNVGLYNGTPYYSAENYPCFLLKNSVDPSQHCTFTSLGEVFDFANKPLRKLKVKLDSSSLSENDKNLARFYGFS